LIENAWDEYRGWVRRARDLRKGSMRWSGLAMLSAIFAAVLGAVAGQAGTGVLWGRLVAFLAAAFAAVTPVLGQDILSVGREAGWIRARATGEAIKSECFRFAARAGEYAGPNAADLFLERREKLAMPATGAGLVPLSDPARDDNRRPSVGFTADWYLDHRLREQKRDFYATNQRTNEKWTNWLRGASLTTAVLAAVLGAASTAFDAPSLAYWIGVLTTLGAMILAYGLMERRQYLAASYGAMAGALGRVEERFIAGRLDLVGLVTATEDLLGNEHLSWTERTTKTIPPPPSVGRSPETAAGTAATPPKSAQQVGMKEASGPDAA
jgi:hypothetical protein